MSDKLFIYPTDTVWGIGGDAFSEQTYIEIAKIKQAQAKKPLSILFSSLEQLTDYVQVPDNLLELIGELYDKEITFGIEKSSFSLKLPEICFKETSYIFVRILNNELISSLIEQNGGPITTTSLNLSGAPPLVEEQDAKSFWKKYAQESSFFSSIFQNQLNGNSSTIVILSGSEYRILRAGRLLENIEQVLSQKLTKHG